MVTHSGGSQGSVTPVGVGSEGSPPTISLPKGGGAIRGIGEKFEANAATGTGSLAVPLGLSPGRSGFGPQLDLTYDSGAGNGPFGFGWQLPLPSIKRKTDKGLPRYQDASESDVFVLSGAEDLVPVLGADGRVEDRTIAVGRDVFAVRRYRPRVEGSFARIERWTRHRDGDAHWRSYSRDNVLTLYGLDDGSRISDPDDPSRVFAWLICERRDDSGNAVRYRYEAEDDRGVDPRAPHERNRGVRSANRYLKRVLYGNRKPLLDPDGTRAPFVSESDLAEAQWLFQVVLDYGEGHYESLPLDPIQPEAAQHRHVLACQMGPNPWSVRPDAFSSYRSTFEVRTYRRCQRILLFHCFDELGPEPTLVSSTELDYADLDYDKYPSIDDELAHEGSTRLGSFLARVTRSGYVRDDTRAVAERDGARFHTYLKRSFPPLELRYSKARIREEVRELDSASLEHMPAGLDRLRRFVDLDGEGVAGVLTSEAGAWHYKPSLGGGRFGAMRPLAAQPVLAGARNQLLDLSGEGRLDLTVLSGALAGYHRRTLDDGWDAFRPFACLPNLVWDDPNLRFVDLTGDGLADVMLPGDDELLWNQSLGSDGFDATQRIALEADEERGPRLIAAGAAEGVFLADMCGDGLADLVRVRADEVCFWPSRGYGRFGAKVTMDDAPLLDASDQFEPQRVRLVDIDGSGTSDILYLGRDGVRLYFNRAGNGWSAPRPLPFPPIDDLTAVQTVDLLGNGTACLTWSSPLPGAGPPLRYVDLMGGSPTGESGKPHLLVEVRNNLGAVTRIAYASSTAFDLADKAAGRPRNTRLPFPVHVVERIETDDRVSGNRFVTRYAYHDGFFDGEEREFRGFGVVEQWDTQELPALTASGGPSAGTNEDVSSNVPPVHTKTWFHTGTQVSGSLLPPGLTPDEEREACRALKGNMLRHELYADDGSPQQAHPYSVTEQSFAVVGLQRRGPNRHAAFLAHPSETLTFHHERDPADPRVAHRLTLEVDDYGNVLKEAEIGYARGREDPDLSPADRAVQARVPVVYSEHEFTNAVDTDAAHRTPLPRETRKYELTGYTPAGGRFTAADFVAPDSELDYEQAPTAGRQRRLIASTRTRFRADDLSGLLPLGTLEPLALAGESYKLALTPGLLARVLMREGQPLVPDPAATLGTAGADRGGYVDLDGDGRLWVPSGGVFLGDDPQMTAAQELAEARAHFFVKRRFQDPFGFSTTVVFDGYDLLPLETHDPVGNVVTAGERDPAGALVRAGNDYRVLQAAEVMDANRNRMAAAHDAVGMVVGVAVMGKPEERAGDSLEGFAADLTDAQLLAQLTEPLSAPEAVLGHATTRLIYDLFAFARDGGPSVIYSLGRETHEADLAGDAISALRHEFAYWDGFGREVQRKGQARPGPVPLRDAAGAVVTDADGLPRMTADDVAPRWIGSGWVVFNNKGKPVRQYEPFFTDTHRFEFDLRIGVAPVVFYDPVGRVVGKLHPNHSLEKVRFTPWREERWDVNDTVGIADPSADPDVGAYFARLPVAEWSPTWHAARKDGALGALEQSAAAKALGHAGTPTVAHLDVLRRPFMTVEHNRLLQPEGSHDELYVTRVELDVEGNHRVVRDAVTRDGDPVGRIVARHDYDLLGTRIHAASMDAGERWTLNDALGKPLRSWDSRGHASRSAYDLLRRLTHSFVVGADPARPGAELLIERVVHGEQHPDAVACNLRGRPCRYFDQAGVIVHDAHDFKGNLVRSSRHTAREYRSAFDWSAVDAVALPGDSAAAFSPDSLDAAMASHIEGTYTTATTFDALDRPRTLTTPDGSVVAHTFDESGLLVRVEVRMSDTPEMIVSDVAHDAKGRRLRIAYGNATVTTNAYDPRSGRMTALRTMRGADVLQDLAYTYDPVGNVTSIRDAAQQTVFFASAVVTPDVEYVYDAAYRLVAATGREHAGGAGAAWSWNDSGFVGLPLGQDGGMRRYVERYDYDAVGNIVKIGHQAANAGWTREYAYEEPSQIEPLKTGNRLSRTTVGHEAGGYRHDVQGNVTAMPHLPAMVWDCQDRLSATVRQVRADGGTAETTHYTYAAGGGRCRKVTDRQAAPGVDPTRRKERVYVGAFEVYREYGADGSTVSLERQTLHVMDGDQRIALIETRTVGDDPPPASLTRYQLGNHLGSACLELDAAARVISYEEFAPYGSTSYQALRSQTETPKRYRYTGKERDEESGLSLHGARYYAHWLGRWSSADPAGLVDGPNLYRYARCNPVVLTDPGGREPAPIVDPEQIYEVATALATTAPALARAAQAWGTATLIAGGEAAGGVGAAPAPAAGAGGAAMAGGAVVGAQVVAATAMALAVQLHMQRGGSIARYGNVFGLPSQDAAFGVLREVQKLRSQPFPVPEPAPRRAPDEQEPKPRLGRVYVTYTKKNTKTGLVYSGRTSAVIDLNKSWELQAQAAVRLRDRNHHIDGDDEPSDPAFAVAVLDKFAVGYAVDYRERYRDVGYAAIRGREQQLIDHYGLEEAKRLGITNFKGGARSDTKPGAPLTENTARGVGKGEILGEVFHEASNVAFGPLAPFTGNKIPQLQAGAR